MGGGGSWHQLWLPPGGDGHKASPQYLAVKGFICSTLHRFSVLKKKTNQKRKKKKKRKSCGKGQLSWFLLAPVGCPPDFCKVAPAIMKCEMPVPLVSKYNFAWSLIPSRRHQNRDLGMHRNKDSSPHISSPYHCLLLSLFRSGDRWICVKTVSFGKEKEKQPRKPPKNQCQKRCFMMVGLCLWSWLGPESVSWWKCQWLLKGEKAFCYCCAQMPPWCLCINWKSVFVLQRKILKICRRCLKRRHDVGNWRVLRRPACLHHWRDGFYGQGKQQRLKFSFPVRFSESTCGTKTIEGLASSELHQTEQLTFHWWLSFQKREKDFLAQTWFCMWANNSLLQFAGANGETTALLSEGSYHLHASQTKERQK